METSAWVEVEAVTAVIAAYGADEIELEPVPKDTPKHLVRYVGGGGGQRSYTRATIARFLGWTRKRGSA
jgi:hypothetical protein